MACNFPVGTYRKNGDPCMRPCGSCIGCRLEYSRQWAVRCVHEAQLYDDRNSFVTLTYNNDHLPEDLSVSKKEVKLFIRRLRKLVKPIKIRYFGCGEYGEQFERPHYHICIFNHEFPDKEVIRLDSKRLLDGKRFKKGHDHTLYSSKDLSSIWQKGFATVGELSFESAGYVARYATKKINGPPAGDHYGDRTPEFAMMSRNPGIGREWIEKYLGDVYPKDFFTMNGRKMRPVRYYDSVLEKLKPEMWEKIKADRIKKGDETPLDDGMRQYHKYKYTKCVTNTLKREIH